MNTILLLKLWRELVIIALIVALSLAVTTCNSNKHTIRQLKAEYINAVEKHNAIAQGYETALTQQARQAEQQFTEQQAKINQLAQDKKHEINALSNQLSAANDSLSALARKAAYADKRVCKTKSSTNNQPIFITVPTPATGSELTAQMATEFAKLSEQCASNYERLKVETEALREWARGVEALN